MRSRTLFFVIIGLVTLSLLVGCSGREFAPKDPYLYWYYHKELPEADRAVEAARAAGKDKQCPSEFNAAAKMKDDAYATYAACRTQEAIEMALKATAMAKALCPAKPAPAPPSPPPPAPKPEAKPTPPPAAKPAPAAKVVVFEEAAMFDIDKADLKPAGKEQLKAYREEAKAELSRADRVIITGHTDNTGSAEYNKKLSLRRAEAVRDYLISIGVDAKKIQVVGKGEEAPIADNSTKEGRAKNRRVEVEVIGVGK